MLTDALPETATLPDAGEIGGRDALGDADTDGVAAPVTLTDAEPLVVTDTGTAT